MLQDISSPLLCVQLQYLEHHTACHIQYDVCCMDVTHLLYKITTNVLLTKSRQVGGGLQLLVLAAAVWQVIASLRTYLVFPQNFHVVSRKRTCI